MTPLVSVILPVYNGRRYLRPAIQSILNEELPSTEVMVVDDGSTDRSLDSIADLDVVKIRLEKNSGQAAAQNIGVSNANGTFVTFLDCDDLMARNGLRWRLEWLIRNEAESVIAGRIAGIIDSEGSEIGSYQEVLNPEYRTPPSYISMEYLKSGGEFPSQVWNMVFTKKLLLKVGPFDEGLRCAHDNDYFYRLLSHSYIPFIDKPTVFYRLHDRNLSGEFLSTGFKYHRNVLAENLMVHLSHGISPRS